MVPNNVLLSEGQFEQLLAHERFKDVLRALDGAAGHSLDQGVALAYRAEAQAGLAEFDEAAASARRALELDAGNTRAIYALGVIAAALDRPQEAVPLLINAAARNPEFAAAHYALGSVLLAAGQIDAAERELRLAAQLDPGNWRYAVGAARVKPAGERQGALRAAYRRGLAERPLSVRLRFKLLGSYVTAPVTRLAGDAPRVDPRTSYAAYQAAMARLPIVTYALLVINTLVLVWLELQGGSQDATVLDKYGAENPFAIIHLHEYWRLLTPVFLHAGVVHLLVNCMSLYFVGTLYERCVGSLRYLFVYLVAGIGGSVLSLAALNALGVGASGAIFGVFGALGVYAFKNRGVFGPISRRLVSSVVSLSIVNLLLPLADPNIDGWAHVGGLLTGLLAGFVAGPWLKSGSQIGSELLRDFRRPATVVVASVVVAALVLALCVLVVVTNPAGA